jgi:phospholipid-binding lipoprotein MlaA
MTLMRLKKWTAVAVLALLCSACATTGGGGDAVTGKDASDAKLSPGQRADPWENWNRKVYAFNDAIDRAVLKPVATAYVNTVPEPVRRGVSNFFGNFNDAWSAVNNFLQGKVANGFQDIMRVGTNTVFGLGGLLDVASEFGLDRQGEDLGQTFGRWGFGPGPYVVWPLFGPSTVRDSIALPFDRSISPALVIDSDAGRAALITLGVIDQRAALLGASRLLDDIALDKYVFTRDAFLQRRQSLVYDGDVPSSPDEGDDGDIEPANSGAGKLGTNAVPASQGASAPAAPAAPAPAAPASAPH